MIAFAVVRTFIDGSKEGVLFTNKDDALDALNSVDTGSTLAVAFGEIYGDDPLEIVEIEI
jgi:hypothetical protein